MTSTGEPSIPYDRVKRLLDFCAAVILMLISLPVQLVVAIAVATKLGRPVLFRQRRPGRGGKIFILIKFRSMVDVDPAHGLITDSARLTRFGAALRATSLDELPTLMNVIRGDMSLVGPRPLLVSYLGRYTAEQNRRHEVRPGVTGLAQVSGRNTVDWAGRFKLDVEYVDSRSFVLDIRILVRTVISVFRREGISADGHVTMHEFGASDGDDQ